jgi:hypothetical protein
MPAQSPPPVNAPERALALALARVHEGVLARDPLAYLGTARRAIRYLAEAGFTVGVIGRPCAYCAHSVADHRTPDGSCGECATGGAGLLCYAYEVRTAETS